MVMECIWNLKQSINTCNYAKDAILKKTAVLKGLTSTSTLTNQFFTWCTLFRVTITHVWMLRQEMLARFITYELKWNYTNRCYI